jgi:D-serine deaminase-like pyridoxal phosphate-dependent protein
LKNRANAATIRFNPRDRPWRKHPWNRRHMNPVWQPITNAAEVSSPALLIDRDRVAENIRRMIAYAGDIQRLRPHVKTHKMAEVIRLQRAAGIDKFKVATLAEAEMVAGCQAADVLLAYQLVGPNADRFARLVKKYPTTRFSTIIDDEGAVRGLSAALSAAGVQADVLLDIDNGMGRTGIPPSAAAAALYRLLGDLPGVAPAGLHVYDGHIRDRDLAQRTADCDAAFVAVDALRDELERAGFPRPRVVAGGTPSFPIHARHADRECSPGTCAFWDASYAGKFPDLEFLHAAALLVRVISKPVGNRLCLDLGYKAVASDNPDPRVVLIGIDDARMVNHSEEHLAVETSRAADYRVGDVVYGIPWHVCPTTALHREVVVVESGRAVGRWPVTARDRMLTV